MIPAHHRVNALGDMTITGSSSGTTSGAFWEALEAGRLEDAARVLATPGLAGQIDPDRFAGFLAKLCESFGGVIAIEASDIATLERVIPVAELVRDAHVDHVPLLVWTAALLRKTHYLDAALEHAEQARRLESSWDTAIAVALVLRAKGEGDAAVEAYQAALAHHPDDAGTHLDLGNLLAEQGQLDAARHHYDAVLRGEPSHPWALPSALFLRWAMKDGDAMARKRLEVIAAAQPGNERAAELLAQIRARTEPSWIGSLPEPADATIGALKQLVAALARRPDDAARAETPFEATIRLNTLEAPSSRLACGLTLAALGWHVTLTFEVEGAQKPDPRKPKGAVRSRLWRYEGNDPERAIEPPSAPVADVVAAIAGASYYLPSWSQVAASAVAGLTDVRDVLACMVYPSMPPAGMPGWLWLPRLQISAALLIAHGRWHGTTPFRLLEEVLLGPDDWVTTAAVLALGQLAVEGRHPEPIVRASLWKLFRQRPRTGYVCYAHPLATTLARLPGVTDKERKELHRTIRELEAPAQS